MSLWCIHGNLQLPSVWDQFDKAFFVDPSSEESPCLTLYKESLWNLEEYTFESWTRSFLHKVSAIETREKPWIMGYSLGGRLALHAIIENPDLWKGAIIIAAHPGISAPSERSAVLTYENRWAKRFISEPWDSLLNEWDALAVFGGIESMLERKEQDYSRERIASMLTGFSKAKQRDLTPLITCLKAPPILYVSGEWDKKYTKIGSMLAAQSPGVKHVVIPGACHRVPWENTADFKESIQYFIDSMH